MHEESPVLTARLRERTGSRYNRRLRDAGGLPAVVYGQGKDPVSISLEAHETVQHIQKGEKVFELALDGTDRRQHALLKDLQFDHLGTGIVHADLVRVELTDRVDVTVPLHLIGDAKGLKAAGAIMIHPVSEIELNVLITNLPEFIEVDVSDMDVGDVIHASEVELPKDTMVLLSDPDGIVAQIQVQAEEEASGEEAEVGAVGGAEPEIIGEKKDEEGGEG